MSDGWQCFRLAARGNEGRVSETIQQPSKKTGPKKKVLKKSGKPRNGTDGNIYLLDYIYRTQDRSVLKVN